MLVRVGSEMGDKSYGGKVPNLKFGEYRYYPQDNDNLEYTGRILCRKVFERILNKNFPKYVLDADFYDDGYEEVGSIGLSPKPDLYNPVVINKGYICFKEATPLKDGTVIYIHDGTVIVYKEKWVE